MPTNNSVSGASQFEWLRLSTRLIEMAKPHNKLIIVLVHKDLASRLRQALGLEDLVLIKNPR